MMTLSLVVQVYNGGIFWQQCWESVVSNMDLFDNIFVSVGKSPCQREDAALVAPFVSEKVRLLVQERSMSSVEHGRIIDDWVGSFHPKGHIFLLCHDDILLREGLLQLRAMDLKEEDAVFGPWRFFFNEGAPRELTVREFRRGDGTPLPVEFFGFMQDQHPFFYNISGLVLPAGIYRRRLLPWHLLSYGARSECCHLCSPGIKFVHQLAAPAVRIRRRSGSEGALMSGKDNQFDTLFYLCLAFSTYRNSWTRRFIVRSVGYALRMNWLQGIRSLPAVWWRLLKYGVSPGAFLKLVWYAGGIVCTAIFNRTARLFHR